MVDHHPGFDGPAHPALEVHGAKTGRLPSSGRDPGLAELRSRARSHGLAGRGHGTDLAGRIADLVSEAYQLGQLNERQEARKSLARAWSVWLDLMMSVSLPGADGWSLLREVLDLEPELRRRFEAFLAPENRS